MSKSMSRNKTIASGSLHIKGVTADEGTAAVSNPQPLFNAAVDESMAAPVFSVLPATISACPKVPLCPLGFRLRMRLEMYSLLNNVSDCFVFIRTYLMVHQ
jgi:hypothetical protein